MKRLFLLIVGVVFALNSYAKDIETQSVLLQGLDKTTGRTSFLTVQVGQPYTYGDLTIRVEKCLKRPPEETPENSVYLTVTEKEEEMFKGWMFSSNPALSSMDHPVYDVWVLECKDKNTPAPVAPVIPRAEITDEIDTENLED